MKNFCYILFTALLCLSQGVRAQEKKTYKVGLFVPLFLDSAYTTGGQYKFGKSFPKHSLPGLEFYQGAEYAMESFQQNGTADVQLHVFDTRSVNGGISRVISSALMDSLDLMIGQVSGNEYLQLAQSARDKNIPFVSATYPNDGGVKSHPGLILINAKLNSHIQSLYNHILVQRGTDNIIWVKRSGTIDNRVDEIFTQFNASPDGGVLKYRKLQLAEGFTEQDLLKELDSTRRNVLIAGSLDEGFTKKLAAACLKVDKAFPLTLAGMPTMEGIREFSRSEYKPIELVYSSTFYKPALGEWVNKVDDYYRKKTSSRPTDLTFKGFQTTFHFVSLLLKYDTALMNNLNDSSLKSFTDFDFRAVRWSKSGSMPDYYENKRVYILRRFNGQVSLLN